MPTEAAVRTKPTLLRREQAAEILQVSLRTLDQLVRSGRLASVKIGPKMRRIPETAIREFVRRCQKLKS